MTDDHSRLRISNADRDKAIQQLQAALDEGRIDLAEFDERTKSTYEAKTNAELDLIFEDLPGGRPAEGRLAPVDRSPQAAPAEAEDGAERRPAERARLGWIHEVPALRALVLVGGICTLIWLASAVSTGDFGNFWPVWPIMGLSIATFVQLVNRGFGRDDDDD